MTSAEARKIVSAVHRGLVPATGVGPLQGVRRLILDQLRREASLPTLTTASVRRSQVDPFVKYAFETLDGQVIETVRIPLEKTGRFSVCVSSQVGCALACRFCATGRMGLRRNLETWEIVEQVRLVRAGLDGTAGERVHGVVFQGMGEPMANLDRVLAAIAVLSDPCAQAIDARNITVCTAGLPSGIRRLAKEAPKVRLGLSIGSARPSVRRSLMPIAQAHSLEEVMDACVEHAQHTGIAPMWAVAPLRGVNDHRADAEALGHLASEFARKSGVRPRISIIPYNPIEGGSSGASPEGPLADPFERLSDDEEDAFRTALRENGFASHRRYSGGGDVAAACGQLAARM
jgi:23S rRNA (adenine2503-C2)-methyltransferase